MGASSVIMDLIQALVRSLISQSSLCNTSQAINKEYRSKNGHCACQRGIRRQAAAPSNKRVATLAGHSGSQAFISLADLETVPHIPNLICLATCFISL